MTDSQLRQDIIDELEFDPSLDAAHIGVAVDKNVVSLDPEQVLKLPSTRSTVPHFFGGVRRNRAGFSHYANV